MNDWVENEKEVEGERKNFTNVIKIHPKSTDERNWFNVIIGLNEDPIETIEEKNEKIKYREHDRFMRASGKKNIFLASTN
jgi:hypothetical protein